MSTTVATHPVPHRVQRTRNPGWRMPANTIYVGRPTKWANSWTEADAIAAGADPTNWRQTAVDLFDLSRALDVDCGACDDYPSPAEIRKALAGRNLACWCPLDQPCHADILLDIANRDPIRDIENVKAIKRLIAETISRENANTSKRQGHTALSHPLTTADLAEAAR